MGISDRWAVHSSPAYKTDGTIYVGSNDHYLYAINTNGSLKWKYLTGNTVISSPSIGTDGTVYVGSDDKNLHAINTDGTLKWKFAAAGPIKSSPAVGTDGTIYVGSDDKYLYAVKSDGTLKWKYITGGYIQSSPAIGDYGTLYFGSNDKYLYALKPENIIFVENEKPSLYKLYAPSPNPFNPSTTISYYLPESGKISIYVYSLTGQKVASLVDGFVNAGTHEVIFDGSQFASGVYFYRLESRGFSKTGKMLLMK